MQIEVAGRLYEADEISGSEKLCLMKDYLMRIAPRGVTKRELMDMFGISERSFYRYVARLERLGVPVVLRISYEYAVARSAP